MCSSDLTPLFAQTVNVYVVGVYDMMTGAVYLRNALVSGPADFPIFTFGGFLLLSASPTLALVVGFQVLRRAGDYGIVKPAREALFTVLPRQDKYKAKNFIDTAVYRGSDAVSAPLVPLRHASHKFTEPPLAAHVVQI